MTGCEKAPGSLNVCNIVKDLRQTGSQWEREQRCTHAIATPGSVNNTYHLAAPRGQLVTTNYHCRLLHQNTGAVQRGTVHQRAICWHCMAVNRINIATAIGADILRRNGVIANTSYGSGETAIFLSCWLEEPYVIRGIFHRSQLKQGGVTLGSSFYAVLRGHSLSWESPIYYSLVVVRLRASLFVPKDTLRQKLLSEVFYCSEIKSPLSKYDSMIAQPRYQQINVILTYHNISPDDKQIRQ